MKGHRSGGRNKQGFLAQQPRFNDGGSKRRRRNRGKMGGVPEPAVAAVNMEPTVVVDNVWGIREAELQELFMRVEEIEREARLLRKRQRRETAALASSSLSYDAPPATQIEPAVYAAPVTAVDPSTYLVWFDLEVDDQIPILEVALRVADKDYNSLDGGLSLLVHWEYAPFFKDYNDEVHSRFMRDSDNTPFEARMGLEEVEEIVCNYLREHGISNRAILAGGGIAFDPLSASQVRSEEALREQGGAQVHTD
ncbi:hypothetical protein DXG03_003065 [Asterophora parasitica]|uniref:Uncharacterized protein n=1 Tax=Asterophora parasitica TaxID=117018 RepID=A0A9P7G550_9AGAR|nr:hypothetical protein DXG03_003065 [Asterophora parasitica]